MSGEYSRQLGLGFHVVNPGKKELMPVITGDEAKRFRKLGPELQTVVWLYMQETGEGFSKAWIAIHEDDEGVWENITNKL